MEMDSSSVALFTLLRIQVNWVGRFLIFPSAVFCLRYSLWQQSLDILTYSWHFLSLCLLGDAQAAALSLVLVLSMGSSSAPPLPAQGRLGAGAWVHGAQLRWGFPGNEALWEILVWFWALSFERELLLLQLAARSEPEQRSHHLSTGTSEGCGAVTLTTCCRGSVSSQTHGIKRGDRAEKQVWALSAPRSKRSSCFPVLHSQELNQQWAICRNRAWCALILHVCRHPGSSVGGSLTLLGVHQRTALWWRKVPNEQQWIWRAQIMTRGWGRRRCQLAHHTRRLWEVPSMMLWAPFANC